MASNAVGKPKWIFLVTGIIGIVSALFIAIAKYHDIQKSQAEAEKAKLEAERVRTSGQPTAPAKDPVSKVEAPHSLPKGEVPQISDKLKVQEKVADFQAEPQFEKYFKANPLILEISGVKVIRLKDGCSVVISVASTELVDTSPSERLRAEKVCRIKCDIAVLKEKQGVYIAHSESLTSVATPVSTQSGASQRSLAEVLEVTTAKVEGLVKSMPPVGRWKSGDGKVFFLATGAILNKNGEPLGSE